MSFLLSRIINKVTIGDWLKMSVVEMRCGCEGERSDVQEHSQILKKAPEGKLLLELLKAILSLLWSPLLWICILSAPFLEKKKKKLDQICRIAVD